MSSTTRETIDWTWQAHSEPSLLAGESFSHYTYTINLYSGFYDNVQNNPYPDQNWLMRAISLALGDPNSDNFTTITDYQSLSNTQEASAAGHTLSVDANGLITTTEANAFNVIDTHTLVFRSTKLSNQLRLVFPDPSQGGWDEPGDGWSGRTDHPDYHPGYAYLREITGEMSAIIIPEPSTYALILGLLALGLAFKRRK